MLRSSDFVTLERGAGNDAKTDEGVTTTCCRNTRANRLYLEIRRRTRTFPTMSYTSVVFVGKTRRGCRVRRFAFPSLRTKSMRAAAKRQPAAQPQDGRSERRDPRTPVLDAARRRARPECTIGDSQSAAPRFFGTHRRSTPDHPSVEDCSCERFVKLLRPCQTLAHSPCI